MHVVQLLAATLRFRLCEPCEQIEYRTLLDERIETSVIGPFHLLCECLCEQDSVDEICAKASARCFVRRRRGWTPSVMLPR